MSSQSDSESSGRWLELSVRVDNEAVEAVCEVFRRHVHGGVAVERDVTGQEYDWSDEVDPASLAVVPVIVKGYLALDDRADEARLAVDAALGHLNVIWPIGELATKEVHEQDWAEAWKAHFHTHRVGHRFVIRPPWQPFSPAPNDVVIDLDPGMAFGTGLHPTTQMCLRAVEREVWAGARVLDVGTGSGILSIAAAKLGARVVALDTDPVAVRVATENVTVNDVAPFVQVDAGSLPRAFAEPFDLIVANIIARVIGDMAAHFAPALTPDGILITSGIIDTRADEVAERLRSAGWRHLECLRQGDWVSFVARR